MTESVASSVQSDNTSFQEAYSNSNTSDNHNNRKQKRRPMQTSSQDARYSHHTYQQQQQWYPQHMYNDEYYYGPSPSRGGYYPRNHPHPQQQRRPQFRHPSASSQINQQVTTRPNSNSSARSTAEVENLRSTLIEQLFENIYECMICIIKIEYVSYFYINKLMYNSLFFFFLDEIRKSGHVIYVIKCFI